MYNPDKIISMSLEEFRSVRDYINEKCGLFFDDDSKYLLEKRLSRRIHEHSLSSFREYHYFLLYDKESPSELNSITDILTTNETYFYRESYQLKAFKDEILPELISKKKDNRIKIWSAGCSSGEEPYTLAILILESKLPSSFKVEVVGSDISQRVLHSARRGIYSESSFRTMPTLYKRKYFKEMEKGKYHIIDEIKEMVTFGKINLLDKKMLNLIPTMDIIFCRNVIIYFNKDSKKKVIQSFYEKLNNSGYLLLGNSESLMSLSTSFELKHLENDMVYQKPAIKSPYEDIKRGTFKW